MPGIFKSFRSTVSPWNPTSWLPALKLLVDNVTGAPIGIQSQNANGPDGIWVPVDLTAAQVASPSAAILADLNATYRLNVAPYTRYQSDGAQLVPLTPSGGLVVPAGFNEMLYAPLTVSSPMTLIVQGQVRVTSYPA